MNHKSKIVEALEKLQQARDVKAPFLSASAIHGAQNLLEQCHGRALKAGWWTDLKTGDLKPVNVAEKLCLIHSEVSEAMEGDRKGLMDDKLPHRSMLEVELADVVIRTFDLAGRLELDVVGAMIEKLAYNAERADHKPENRAAEGGKAY